MFGTNIKHMSEQQQFFQKVKDVVLNLLNTLKKISINIGENKKTCKMILVLVIILLLYIFRFEIKTTGTLVYFKLKQLFS